MSLPVGTLATIQRMRGAEVHEVVTRDLHLQALEDGEIRHLPERHVFVLDEATGHLLVAGDHGSFSGQWSGPMRGGVPLRDFLAGLSFHYFMTKTAGRPYMVADVDATIADMRGEIVSARRAGDIEAGTARSMWEALDGLVGRNGEEAFIQGLVDDADLYERFCDGAPHIVRVEDPLLRAFWDGPWEAFRRQVLLVDASKAA